MPYRHDNLVVCGVDGSDASFNALEWAVQEAATRGAHLDVLCCFQQPGYTGRPMTEEPAGPLMEAGPARFSKPLNLKLKSTGSITHSISLMRTPSLNFSNAPSEPPE